MENFMTFKPKVHPSFGKYSKKDLEELAQKPLQGVRTLPKRKKTRK